MTALAVDISTLLGYCPDLLLALTHCTGNALYGILRITYLPPSIDSPPKWSGYFFRRGLFRSGGGAGWVGGIEDDQASPCRLSS